MECSLHLKAENAARDGVLLSEISIILRELSLCPTTFTWTLFTQTTVGRVWLTLPSGNEGKLPRLLERLRGLNGVTSVGEKADWSGTTDIIP